MADNKIPVYGELYANTEEGIVADPSAIRSYKDDGKTLEDDLRKLAAADVDLNENLEAIKEAAQKTYAEQDGTYPNMTAGAAMSLVGDGFSVVPFAEEYIFLSDGDSDALSIQIEEHAKASIWIKSGGYISDDTYLGQLQLFFAGRTFDPVAGTNVILIEVERNDESFFFRIYFLWDTFDESFGVLHKVECFEIIHGESVNLGAEATTSDTGSSDDYKVTISGVKYVTN